jgi:toxin CptA
MKSAPAIAFDYRPSRWLLAALVAIVLLALAAVALSGLYAWLKLALLACVIAYAVLTLRGFLRPRFTHVTWHSAGHWRLRDAADSEQVAQLQHTVVLGVLIVLTLRFGPKRTLALPLFPDNCDAETRRRLRVRIARGLDEQI